jgi:tRNA (uracil-5-)-methyltransferase
MDAPAAAPTAAAPVEVAPAPVEAPAPVAPAPAEPQAQAEHAPMEHSNTHLLKINTHDLYSTGNAIKKQIGKKFPRANPAPAGEQQPPVLEGLVRTGKNPSSPVLFMSFETEAQRADAAAKLTGGLLAYRSRPWLEEAVTEKDLQLTHKKGKRTRDDAAAADPNAPPAVCPWRGVAYDEQLTRKAVHCRKVLRYMVRYAQHGGPELKSGALLETVVPSPILEGYRNNVQLSCGFTAEEMQPCIGFQAGASVKGVVAVIPPAGVPTAHPLVSTYVDAIMAQVYAPLIAAHPQLVMYDKGAHQGFWRKFHLRHNAKAEVMLDIEVKALGVADDVMAAVRQTLTAVFTSFTAEVPVVEPTAGGAATVRTRCVSLQLHPYDGTSAAPPETPREVLFGPATLTEQLLGLTFELSPGAFFQVNRLGTEQLLSKAADAANLDKDKTVLLDLCCGTGTIGLCLASRVNRVIGIEMVAAAIENAKVNAARNGVANAEYICARVEHALRDVLGKLPADADVVAILDPPRCGVHGNVIKWLRNAAPVRRLVYISCEQRALETDCEGLTKRGTTSFHGAPFRVCGSFGVDLFPHTPHVEMVVVLERTEAPPAPAAPAVAAAVAAPVDADAETPAVAPADAAVDAAAAPVAESS